MKGTATPGGRHLAAMFGLLMLAAPQVHGAWVAERATGPVTIEADGRARALEDGERLADGAVLHLRQDGALTLWRNSSRLRTRGPAHLAIHSSGDPRVGLLRLSEGAARIESPDTDDLRVNVGSLRVRLSGGEAWVAADPDADRVCALRGRVDIQPVGSTQTLTLRQLGACLERRPDGVIDDERPLLETLNARLARADGGASPLPVTFQTPPLPTYRADREQQPPAPRGYGAADEVDAPRAIMVAAAPPGPKFYVVLAAFAEEQRAHNARAGLSSLNPTVLPASDRAVWRLAVGPYATREAAERARGELRRTHPDAWILVADD